MMTAVPVIFVLVYLAMVLGGLPGLKIDRAGAALVGAIAMMAIGVMSLEEAWGAVDVPTIALLFGMMVISAQFRLAGFYSAITAVLAAAPVRPAVLLLILVYVSGFLSAILANDIVCLAMSAVLLEACIRRGLDPMPFLLGLACASNIGSAATLIGNPQNILIGQSLGLDFLTYLADGGIVALVGLFAAWAVIAWMYRNRWHRPLEQAYAAQPPRDWYQAGKGLLVVTLVMLLFLFSDLPRELVALGAAGLLLMSRKMASPRTLSLVDWQLLVLFIALFIVNHALAITGWFAWGVERLATAGIDAADPVTLFFLTAVLSNLVSNVPAVMLLLPVAEHPIAGPVLALSSTLAGNFIVVGSIANIIVVMQAAAMGFSISWRDHIKVGIPVTLITLLIAGLWLVVRYGV